MVRIVKRAEVRQDEILDAAQRLFLRDGYADTPIQAILDEVGIAKGTFYHHYPSKSDLLDALVRRVIDQMMVFIGTIIDDPALSAVEKMTRLCQRGVEWKYQRREMLMDLVRPLESDTNVVLKQRLERDAIAAYVPRLAEVIAQGVKEGSFDSPYPLQAARVLYALSSLVMPIRDAVIDLSRPLPSADEVKAMVYAYNDATERVLGAPRGSMALLDADGLLRWLDDEARRRSS
jgi:AcrR family transcriptional regulator